MAELAIVCPSRGRPSECMGMIHSALATSDADVLVYIDRDDPELERYEQELIGHSMRVKPVIADPVGRGHAVNRLCDAFRDYRLYLVVSDDITYVRSGWDKEVARAMDAFGDDIGCVHLASENGMPHVNWACVTRRWLDILGWFNYPKCGYFTQDTIIQVLAEALDRITFIEPKVIQHDALQHSEATERFSHDCVAFLAYMAQQFGTDLKKLRVVCR